MPELPTSEDSMSLDPNKTPKPKPPKATSPKPVALGSSPIYLELVAERGDPTK